MEAGRDRLLLDDGVHFTPKGYELLGKAVAKAIRTQLQLL
jgi:lysophospholipase L1-like esterase